MGAEVAKVERADLGRDQKPAENAESAKMAWYKQILLAGVISLLMMPAIYGYVHSQHQALLHPSYTPPAKPIVWEGTIDLKTGDVKIVKN